MARKYSSEYKALQPYVVEDARKVANAVLAGAASGGGGGGLVAHTIYGPYHTGELLQSQASWAATKVELSNHAALPDVHHAKAHGITDSANHTVTGSQYQIVGLTSTNTLGLLTAASSPTANQVVKTDGSSAVTLVDLTVSSDLFMTGTLDFGTNTIAEDASYLQFAGSKALRFAQNIGNANWTVYNTGGAAFGGSVDINSGGDLTVAGSGAYAGNSVLFADSSGGNVGILMAPDPQVALDVNGPARATYFIGPHAIQLKNVLLLSHFDGRAPYETNYTGEPNGHMGQVGTVSGGLIFRPGKFYKAAQMAEYTVNLCTNPSIETNSTGWSGYSSGTVSRSATQALFGSYSLAVTAGAANRGAQITVTGLTAFSGHTLSAWVYCDSAITIKLGGTDNVDKDHGDTTASIPAATWTRVTRTITTDAHTSVILRIYSTTATTFYVDGVQVENKNYVTAYADGSLGGYNASGAWFASGNGHSWTGTAHASTTVRSEGRLSYLQPGNFGTLTGTLMCWVKFDTAGISRTIFTGSTNGSLAVVAGASTIEVAQRNVGTVLSVAQTWTAETWYHIAVTWEGRVVKAYINGALSGTATAGADFVTPALLYVGRAADDTSTLDGLIDDLVILSHVSAAGEIKSVYESNAPVFAETSMFSFRPTPKGLINGDDEGFWMRDSAGKPVLGIYGGETYKASWGGFDLYPGDLLIGNNAASSSAIFWDQSAGTFGFYGAGSATAQASVATDGSITAGAGALALNSSGIQITAPSTQTAIGSYKFLVTGKTITSGLAAYYNSGSDTYTLGMYSDSSDIGTINNVIAAQIGGGGTITTSFVLTNSLSSATTTYTLTGGNVATWNIGGYLGIGVTPTRSLQVSGGGVFAGGEETGLAGYTQLTNTVNTSLSSGTGTVKMAGATSRNNVGWLKLYSGTTAIYVPYWTTITG